MMRVCGRLVLLAVLISAEPAAAAPAGGSVLPKGAAVVQSRHLLLAISASGKRAYGFSHRTGEVSSIRIAAQGKNSLLPVVGDSVGCFIAGTKAYAYGADSGAWDVVDLEVEAQPVVSADLVRIDVGPRIYLFASTSKAWQVIDLSKDEE